MTKLINDHVFCLVSSKTVAIACRNSVPSSEIGNWALDRFLFHSTQRGLSLCADKWVEVVKTETEFEAELAKATFSVTGGEVEDPLAQSDPYLESESSR